MDSEQLKTAKRMITNTWEELNNTTLQQLREKMIPEQLRANDLAKMRGASSWLTTLPLKSENFDLNKREFYDAPSLRYRWTPKYLPSTCPCGKRFDVDHAMSCMKFGFVHRRKDDVRDLFASLLKDVSHDVEVELHLQPLTGEHVSLFFLPKPNAFYFRYIFINDFVMTYILCSYTVIFYWMFFNKSFYFRFHCTSMLWSIMDNIYGSIGSCQNKVSADQYHLAVSQAQVSTHRGRVLFLTYPLTSY